MTRKSLSKAASQGDTWRCRTLLDADPNLHLEPDEQGLVPLHHAASRGRVKTCRFLIQHGSDVNAKDEKGRTPLHLACDHGHLEVCEALLLGGADKDAACAEKRTGLHQAAEAGVESIVKLLLMHGADPSLRTMNGQTVEDVSTCDTPIEALADQVPSNLLRDLRRLLDDSFISDVMFEVEGTSIPGCRSLLAARSTHLRELLFGGFMEAECGTPVVIKEVSPVTFRHMLEYLYTGDIPKLTTEEYMQLHGVANRFLLPELQALCEQHMGRSIHRNSAVQSLMWACEHGCPKLQATCIEVILNCGQGLSDLPGVKELPPELLLDLVKAALLAGSGPDLVDNSIDIEEGTVSGGDASDVDDAMNNGAGAGADY